MKLFWGAHPNVNKRFTIEKEDKAVALTELKFDREGRNAPGESRHIFWRYRILNAVKQ